MNRLEQEAADELAAHEQQRAWRERAKQDWARSNQPAPTATLAPTISERERTERNNQIAAGILPF